MKGCIRVMVEYFLSLNGGETSGIMGRDVIEFVPLAAAWAECADD